ncbi:MAG: family efflux transporter subunit [Firmicutes bacterium]|nr:family efflux transporter subunit [Bacillota bacterium]
MKRFNKKWLLGIIIVVVVALAIGLIVKRSQEVANQKKPALPSNPVQVVQIKPGAISVTQHYMGKTQAVLTADIASRITANILAIHKREGDIVKQGETLVALDDLALGSKVRAMDAEVRSAESLRSAAENNNAVQRASFERDEYLYNNKGISLETYERSAVAMQNAQSQLSAARERVSIARENLSAVMTESGYANITAPFAGVIVKRMAEPGEVAVPGKLLLVLQGMDQGYKIISQIPQEQTAVIKAGTQVMVTAEADKINGAVNKIFPALGTNNLASAEIILDRIPAGLPTGATVGLDFVMSHVEGIIVPRNSLVRGANNTFVVRIDENNIAHQVAVVVLGENDQLTAVTGISENSMVVIGPENVLMQLMDGVIVKPIMSEVR